MFTDQYHGQKRGILRKNIECFKTDSRIADTSITCIRANLANTNMFPNTSYFKFFSAKFCPNSGGHFYPKFAIPEIRGSVPHRAPLTPYTYVRVYFWCRFLTV